MTAPLLDARGVEIEPGDTVIYGFGVSRSVAMAEGVVLEAEVDADGYKRPGSVSLTPTGLVRIRVVRRSYSSGSKPVVSLTPNRIVVLKPCAMGRDGSAILPPSPLPTQDEAYRLKLQDQIAGRTEDLRLTQAPSYWARHMTSDEARLASYLAHCAKELEKLRKELRALDG